MPLDPNAAALLAAMDEQGMPAFEDMSVSQARDAANAFRELQGEPADMASVVDRTVPGPAGRLPIRVYTPPGSPSGILIYIHGGGWVIGNIEVADGPCRALAVATGCVVVSTQYRLAPESSFPAAPEDCYAVTCWVAEHQGELVDDAAGLVVAGDSAGGNLAAVVALMARDRGGPALTGQMLVYPATSFAFDSPSITENGEGYLLTAGSMRWFAGHYLADDADGKQAYASPLLADDLSGLPPAFIATMEFDPLRDDGARYGEALRAAGGQATVKNYAGQIHGTLWLAGALPVAAELVADIGREVRTLLG